MQKFPTCESMKITIPFESQLTYNILSVLWNYALVLAMFQTNGDNHVQRPFYCICQKFGCNGNDPKRSVKIRFHNPHNYVHQSYHCIHNRNWAAHAWRLPCTKTHSIARLLIYYWPTGSNDAPGLLFWQSVINVDDLLIKVYIYFSFIILLAANNEMTMAVRGISWLPVSSPPLLLWQFFCIK